eukprot:gene4175-4423_t
MEISRDLGRSVWGFPKEMASFEWGKQSVLEMTFLPTKLFVTHAIDPEIDSVTFTGREGQVLFMPQVPVGVIVGSPGQLSLPEPLDC